MGQDFVTEPNFGIDSKTDLNISILILGSKSQYCLTMAQINVWSEHLFPQDGYVTKYGT